VIDGRQETTEMLEALSGRVRRLETQLRGHAGDLWAADLALAEDSGDMFAGRLSAVWVRVRNVGGDSWPGPDEDGTVRLVHEWLDSDGKRVVARGLGTDIAVVLPSGHERAFAIRIVPPQEAGRYLLGLDIVHESGSLLGPGARMSVDVRRASEATQPPLERLPESLAEADPGFFDRVARLCGMTRQETMRLFAPGHTADVKIPALGAPSIRIRPATSDLQVVDWVFTRSYHLPPLDMASPRIIVDLGANIGLTMAHYAALFPDARIIGLELDEANVQLCRRNIAPWSDRCTVIQGAAWIEDAEVQYVREGAETYAYRVEAAASNHSTSVPAMSLDTLLAVTLPDDTEVDFMKLNVEGAERELFRAGGEWPSRVRTLRVETHPPYTPTDCVADLIRLGFSAKATGDDLWVNCVTAWAGSSFSADT
jgi:FkbM family methyltransferase